MKKDVPFKWDEDFQRAFESIKAYLTKQEVLLFSPIKGKPLMLYKSPLKLSWCLIGSRK